MKDRNIMSPKLVITKSPIVKIFGYKGLHSVSVESGPKIQDRRDMVNAGIEILARLHHSWDLRALAARTPRSNGDIGEERDELCAGGAGSDERDGGSA
jgi:hypothetical protein